MRYVRHDVYHHFPCTACGSYHYDHQDTMRCIVMTVERSNVLAERLMAPKTSKARKGTRK